MAFQTTVYSVPVRGNPFLRIVVSFPIACFSAALATDIVYAATADMLWADFSDWLLALGMLMAVLAAIAGIADAIGNRRPRAARHVLGVTIGSLLVLALGLLDNLVHSRDAWTSVVPQGILLSAVTVVVMLITVWIGSATVYPAGAAVTYPAARP